MVMVASDTLMTEPAPDLLDDIGWRAGAAISDSRRRLNYYRTTIDDRIVFGKGGVGVGFGAGSARRGWGPSPRLPELRRHLRRTYPSLADVPVTSTWTAPVEYSATSLLFCAPVPGVDGAWALAGYSGDGVGPSRVLAKMLSSLILGEDDVWARSRLVGAPRAALPREPLRYIGGQGVLRAVARQDASRTRAAGPVGVSGVWRASTRQGLLGDVAT